MKHRASSILLHSVAVSVAILPALAFGQSADRNFSTNGKPSASYQKERRMLPGENVVTPSGQKMKVWSTEGPVPVSRAPEPFEDPRDRVNPNVGVVLDGRGAQGAILPQAGAQSPAGRTAELPTQPVSPVGSQGAGASEGDSFDMNE